MTISNNDIDNLYDGDDAETEFDFNFDIFDTSDVAVYLVTTATGVAVLQTETSHYEVSSTNNNYRSGPGGTVTMVTAPASTEQLYIVYAPDMTQDFDMNAFSTMRNVSTTTTETTLDQIVTYAQKNKHTLGTALKIPVNESGLTVEMPNAVDRAGKVLSFDSSGNATVSAAGGGDSTTHSAVGTAVAGASSEKVARAAINCSPIFDSRDYADINTAISTIGATVCELHIWQAETLTANLDFPSTMNVVVHQGGSIDYGTYTLQIEGGLQAGNYRIFYWDVGGLLAQRGTGFDRWNGTWFGMIGDGSTDNSAFLQKAIDVVKLSQNGILYIPPVGAASKYYKFTTGVTYTGTKNAQGITIEGSGLGSYMFWDGAGISGLTFTGTYATAKSQICVKNIAFGGAAGTDDGLVLEDIRNGCFEQIVCAGFGDVGVKLLGSFGNNFIHLEIGGQHGSPGSVAQALPVTGLYLGDSSNSGANVNAFHGGKIQSCTTAMELAGESYGNSWHGFSVETNTTGIIFNSDASSQIHATFHDCELADNGTDWTDTGSQITMKHFYGTSTGGQQIINSDIGVGANDARKYLLVGDVTEGYIRLRGAQTGTGLATIGLASSGAVVNASLLLSPLGTGEVKIGDSSNNIGIDGTGDMAINGTASLPAVQLLSSTTVPLNANGQTTIYTVPTGKTCVLHSAILVGGADAGTSDISIGQNGATTDFVGVTNLDNLDAANDAVLIAPVPSATPATLKAYAAATVIEADVANQAGGATNTLLLYGTLY